MVIEASNPPQEQASRSPGRRRLWLAVAFVAWLLILSEGASRAYFAIRSKSSFLAPDLDLAFYGELRGVEDAPVTRDDGRFDVLLLGGSALHPSFSEIETYLGPRLEEAFEKPVRVYNLARAAHSSRDSLIKYKKLAAKRFDLVVLYHGINEARLNNAPLDLYRDDYTHSSWYARVDAVRKHPEAPILMLPFALHFAGIKIGENTGWIRYLPRHTPRDEWTRYGGDIRTDRALEANLEEIVAEARLRADPLVLITFVTYLPAGYDLARAHDQQAPGVDDYANGGTSGIDLWGAAPNVVKALAAHNAVVRRVAADAPEVILVDLARTYPAAGEYLVDICHFSDAGSLEFVNRVVPAIGASRP